MVEAIPEYAEIELPSLSFSASRPPESIGLVLKSWPLVLRLGFDLYNFFVFKKRPPDPLTLFKA